MPKAVMPLELTGQAIPAAPAATGLKLFGKNLGGEVLPSVIGGSTGNEYALQQTLARGDIVWWSPGSTVMVSNGTGITTLGTATATSLATTNNASKVRRVEALVTVAATTAVAGIRGSGACCWRGNAAGEGGFFAVFRGGPATGPSTASTHRFWMGFRGSSSAPTDVEPSSIGNAIGMGYDAADTNLQIMTNDNTGTATKTSLGIAVPSTDRANLWELILHCDPNSTEMDWEFRDLSTSWSPTPQSGVITTDLPSNTGFLTPGFWSSVGGTNSVTGVMVSSFYCETDT